MTPNCKILIWEIDLFFLRFLWINRSARTVSNFFRFKIFFTDKFHLEILSSYNMDSQFKSNRSVCKCYLLNWFLTQNNETWWQQTIQKIKITRFCISVCLSVCSPQSLLIGCSRIWRRAPGIYFGCQMTTAQDKWQGCNGIFNRAWAWLQYPVEFKQIQVF